MKRKLRILGIGLLLSMSVFAQTPPPPPDNPSNGGTNGPVGGGAPIGSGLVFLMAMAGAWGGKKVYCTWKKLAE